MVRVRGIVAYHFVIAIISHSVLQELAVEWVGSGLLLEFEQSLIGRAFPASLRRRLDGCEEAAREDGDDCGEGTHFRGKL